MAEILGLLHNGGDHGVDGVSSSGYDWELKSSGVTKKFGGFCIGRDLTLKKVEWCETQYWGFAFYTDKTGDEIYRMVFAHPQGLVYRWSFLKEKFFMQEGIIEEISSYARIGMVLADLTSDRIIELEEAIEPIFNRGGRQLRQQTIRKGDLDRAIELELGMEVDLEGDIPAQLLAFEKAHPLR